MAMTSSSSHQDEKKKSEEEEDNEPLYFGRINLQCEHLIRDVTLLEGLMKSFNIELSEDLLVIPEPLCIRAYQQLVQVRRQLNENSSTTITVITDGSLEAYRALLREVVELQRDLYNKWLRRTWITTTGYRELFLALLHWRPLYCRIERFRRRLIRRTFHSPSSLIEQVKGTLSRAISVIETYQARYQIYLTITNSLTELSEIQRRLCDEWKDCAMIIFQLQEMVQMRCENDSKLTLTRVRENLLNQEDDDDESDDDDGGGGGGRDDDYDSEETVVRREAERKKKNNDRQRDSSSEQQRRICRALSNQVPDSG